MSKPLVIVESPAKARTISNYLKNEYIIKASVGHIKDLPESRLGVDIEKGFAPEYQVIKGKVKVLKEINIIHNFSMSIIFLQHAPGATFEILTSFPEKGSRSFLSRGERPALGGTVRKWGTGRAWRDGPTISFKNLDHGKTRLFYFGFA